MSSLQKSARLLSLSLVVLTIHTGAALLTEAVFTMEGFAFPWFYVLLENGIFVQIALGRKLYRFLFQAKEGKTAAAQLRLALNNPRRLATYVLFPHPALHPGALQPPPPLAGRRRAFVQSCLAVGASMAVSHGAGYASHVHLNYTTALLFKSAKVPAIILGSVFINGSRVSRLELLCAVVFMTGMVLFGLAERLETPRFDIIGLVCIAVNLLVSAVTANLQQKVLHAYSGDLPAEELGDSLMIIEYLVSFCLYLVWNTLCTSELSRALTWCMSHPGGIVCALADDLLSFLGIVVLMAITTEFDATRANVICSARKVLSIFLSYFIFPKPFSSLHALGFAMVVAGGVRLQCEKIWGSGGKEEKTAKAA